MPPTGPADTPKRGRPGLLAAIAGAAVAIVALGAGGYVYLNRGSSADAQNSLWSQYFFPARVGYTCTYASGLAGFTATQTERVASVEDTRDGVKIGLHSEASTDLGTGFPTGFPFPSDFPTDFQFPTDFPTDFPFPSDFPTGFPFPSGFPTGHADVSHLSGVPLAAPQTTDVDLTYLIANDGTLKAPAQAIASGMGLNMSDGLVFPSIEDLRAGKSRTSSVTVSLGGSDVPALKDVFGPNGLQMTLELTMKAADPEKITTKAGTYTDVVGIAVSYSNISIKGNVPALNGVDFGDLVKGFLPTVTTWYARGVGMVRTDVKTILDVSAEVTGCTG
jgi:hypothetical protein